MSKAADTPTATAAAAPVPVVVADASVVGGLKSWVNGVDVYEETRGFASGVASGISKLVVGHPFDTVKVRMQTEGGLGRFKGPWDCLAQTMKAEGFRGLYKGGTPPLFGWSVIDSVLWSTLINAQKRIRAYRNLKPDAKLSYADQYVAGTVAGWASCIPATPIEQVKARLQVQYSDPNSIRYSGPIDCARKLIANNGVLGLYKGWAGTFLFRSFIGAYFTAFFYFEDVFARTAAPPVLHKFLAGGVASTVLWCVAFPADVLKNRMMAQPDVQPRKYPTLRACARHIYRTEGKMGFWRGFVPCILRAFPANGTSFVAASYVQNTLMPSRAPKHAASRTDTGTAAAE